MADIPLRTYIEQIDSLVDKKQIDEAIAHCKHILTYYPKHLGTYQALGKALLEKGRHADAADIFNRVLAAVPEDYVSHIGMSIVCEDQGNVDGALWHMERAYEVMPSNPAIQDELRRLYGRRDGLMPPRTRLTRGALARMYVKGGLFAQAEAELKKALADAPERLDLATLLAQVYWQTNRRQEAADVCSSLVEKLPYNQDANRMLADILLTQGRTAELVPYRQRLEALDPYAAFAEPGTDGHGPAPKPESVMVPKLDYTPDMAASAAGTPDWVASIGATLEEPSQAKTVPVPDWLPKTAPSEAEVAQAAELPEWLQGAQIAVGAAGAGAPGEGLAEAAPLPSSEGEMPDWMKSAVTTPLDMPDWMKAPPPAKAAPAAAPVAEESPGWMASAASSGEVPDWMKDMAPSAESTAQGGQPAAPAFAAPAAEPEAEATPDWLKAAEAAPAEELPDWLREAAPAAEAPSAAPAPAPDVGGLSEEEALRWLEGLALQQGAKPEEMVSQPPAAAAPEVAGSVVEAAEPAPAEELPDWLRPTEAAPAEELPTWLQTPAPAAAEETLLPWLKEAAPEPAPEAPAAPEAEPTAAAPAEELPDWLKEAGPAQDLPEWMQAPAAAAPAEPAAAFPDWLQAVEAASPAAELPDWLKEQTPPPAAEKVSAPAAELPAEAPATSAEKPDWLKAMEAESDAYEASLASTPAAPAPEPTKAKLRPEELPDFLQMASPEAVERAEQPTHLAEEMEAEQAALPQEEPPLAAAELPDWLKDFAGAPAEPTPQPAEPIEWLESTPSAPSVAPAEPTEPAQPAEPAAEMPEWVQRPTEKREGAPVADLPSWVQEMPPGPTDTVSLWLAKQKVPDWLRKPEEEAKEQPPEDWLHGPVEEAPEVQTVQPGAAPAEEVPAVAETTAAPGEVSEEDALRWLESLAAQEGAEAEELAAKPQERRAQPPSEAAAELMAALAPEARAAPALPLTPEAPAAPPQPPDETLRKPEAVEEQITKPLEQLPSWLTLDILESTPTEPPVETPAQVAEVPAAPAAEAQPPTEQPPAPTGAVETPSKPPTGIEDLSTQRLGQLPTWLEVETPSEAMAPVEAAPAAGPAEPPAPAAAIEPAAMGEDEAMRWLESLAAQQGARPEELITKPEERLAQPPAWVAAETAAAEALPPAEAVPTEAAEVHPAAAELQPPAAPAPVEPAAMGEDEALRWLESLAAQQGARPEELITKPEERLAEPPSWVTAEAQAVAEPQAEAPAPAEATVEAPAPLKPAEPVAPAEPSAMGEDEALRWLESLAVQQGARPEELITKPEERLAQPPAWVAAETAAAEGAPAAEAGAAAEARAPAGAALETPVSLPEAPAAAEAPAPLEPGAMSDDEALRWLESLAVQQGARPEELITKPEERLAEPPTWVEAEIEAAEAQAVAPEAQPAAEAKAPVVEFTASAEPEPAAALVEDESARDSRLTKLAERLAAGRRAKEAEIEARFEAQRTEQEAARRAVQEKLIRKPAAVQPAPEAAAAGPLAPTEGVTVAPIAAERPVAPKPKAPPAPKPKKAKRSKSPYAAEAPETVLALARQHLAEGNHDLAAEPLAYLVASNQMLPHTIGELEAYTARQYSAPLLQILGDAYMKTNQLQKALETYRQALGHL